jgi:adenine-specific DNA methylase
MIENIYDIPFTADLARREKAIQQNYRPIIAVHKWFARRPGTLFRALLLSEFSVVPLRDAFYRAGNLRGKTIVDPFMGGGTPLIEANRMGADIKGFDINPMSYWIVRQEMEPLDIDKYQLEAQKLREFLYNDIGHLHETRCEICGNEAVPVKYFLWVKTWPCPSCGEAIDLFPGYLISENIRHPRFIFYCPQCGKLTETANRNNSGSCVHCGSPLHINSPIHRNQGECPSCHVSYKVPGSFSGSPGHRLIAMEYYCPHCNASHKGRFFKSPNSKDFEKIQEAKNRLASMAPHFIPNDDIPSGDETNRLHRWGYAKYRELFNSRQLLGLEISCRYISSIKDEHIRNALATNLSDLLRYQNMLCRYDTSALKSLDIFSIHGFPVGLMQCESNFLGIKNGSAHPVGSGGWLNIIEKFIKAKTWCAAPFEIRNDHSSAQKTIVPISGEWVGDTDNGLLKRSLDINCGDSSQVQWLPNSIDGIFTDPPYYGNVQYAELMDFCYVWLRNLVKKDCPQFAKDSTRNENELTGNDDMLRGIEHFTLGLSRVFSNVSRGLKKNAPLVFTYHHNDINAYFPVAVAMLDSSLSCTAVLPCPAEMGASIHIKGTGSSIVDSIFVCRKTTTPTENENSILLGLRNDIIALSAAPYTPTKGDIRSMAHGHIIRYCINTLLKAWKNKMPVKEKIKLLNDYYIRINGPALLDDLINIKVELSAIKKESQNEFTFV